MLKQVPWGAGGSVETYHMHQRKRGVGQGGLGFGEEAFAPEVRVEDQACEGGLGAGELRHPPQPGDDRRTNPGSTMFIVANTPCDWDFGQKCTQSHGVGDVGIRKEVGGLR